MQNGLITAPTQGGFEGEHRTMSAIIFILGFKSSSTVSREPLVNLGFL